MGGKVLIGPDNDVYVGIGDVAGHRTQSENNPKGAAPDGTGGILRITPDGQIVDNPPLGDTMPLALYYAYGIRNTFGMDFDPETGNLWDSENGNTFGDEINLVKQYENTIFMGDVDNGNLYNFKLNEDRTGLALEDPLEDKVANTPQELQDAGAVLGQGFGVITDMQVGPDDGYLYILTLNGSIYRIVPNSTS